MLSKLVNKYSYWLGYIHAKSKDNQLTVNIENAEVAQDMMERKIIRDCLDIDDDQCLEEYEESLSDNSLKDDTVGDSDE